MATDQYVNPNRRTPGAVPGNDEFLSEDEPTTSNVTTPSQNAKSANERPNGTSVAKPNAPAPGNTTQSDDFLQDDSPQSTPENEPVGWGDDKPKFLPDMPDEMPGMTKWEVDEDQTVQGRLEKILDDDSVLMEQTRQQTLLQASKAGLQNSLMAISAAEKNVLDKAFSIASQDAATFARSAEFNALMKNQFSQAEQAFMHNAMLSEQNFRQAKELQQQQIAGQLRAAAAAASAADRRAKAQMEHQYKMANLSHAQNLETMELAHTMDIERLGVVQDYNIETMGAQTQFGMMRDENQTALQMMLNDQQFGQQLTINQQQYGFQAQLNYQQNVAALNAQHISNVGLIGQAGVSGPQMNAAVNQSQQMLQSSINLMGSLFASPSGPAAQAGIQGNPQMDYMYYPKGQSTTMPENRRAAI